MLFVWECSLLDSGLAGFIFIFDMNRTSTQRQKLWDSYPPLIYSMLIASLLAHSWLAISDTVFSGLAQYWVRVKGKLWVSLSNSSISLELCYENIVIITNWQILVKITMFKALNRSLSTNIVGFILQRDIILVFFFCLKVLDGLLGLRVKHFWYMKWNLFQVILKMMTSNCNS